MISFYKCVLECHQAEQPRQATIDNFQSSYILDERKMTSYDVIHTLPQTNEPYGRNLTVVQCGQNQRLSSISLSTSSSSANKSTLFLSPSRQALWYAAGHPSQISFWMISFEFLQKFMVPRFFELSTLLLRPDLIVMRRLSCRMKSFLKPHHRCKQNSDSNVLVDALDSICPFWNGLDKWSIYRRGKMFQQEDMD